MNRRWLSVVLLLGTAMAFADRVSFEEHAAVQESLSRVHPRMRASWLRERGLDDSYYTTFHRPESTGLLCIGRWPWGPSWELAGRDTFLYLGSGSGVRILSITDSVHPRMLGQINARSLVSQVVVQDSLLFVACGSWGAQMYSVSDPANPRELGSMDAVIGDVCVEDSFCYAVGGDSLRIYNVARPNLPSLVGAIRDSGDLVVVANGHAFSAGRWMMNIYDVTDPSHPTWANSRGGPAYAMFVRRNLLFCTAYQPDYMTALNISDPLNITVVSTVNGYGGEGLYVDDSYAYLSCNYEHEGLFIVDVSDSSHPALRDSINPEGVTEWDPLVPHVPGYGYLADDYGGLTVLDLHEVSDISEAWSGYKASQAVDVHVDGQRAYVANEYSGLQIIDIANPADPVSLGMFDTIGSKSVPTAVARDSFAFISMRGTSGRRFLRVLDVTDPSNPVVVAQESCFNPPEDYVLKDTFIYATEANRFQVFNVARPREPVRVGSCVLPGYSGKMDLQDSIAYVTNTLFSLVNVSDPSSPVVVGNYGARMQGVDAVDTIMYGTAPYTGLLALSVANPASPYALDSLYLTDTLWWNDVVVVDSLAYVGGERIWVVDVSDPRNLRLIPGASWTPPYLIERMVYSEPFIYAACLDAGVCILETVQVGVGEELGHARLAERPGTLCPNPASKYATLRAGPGLQSAVMRDVLGRLVRTFKPSGAVFTMDLHGLRPGLYFIELRYNAGKRVEKLIKR